MNLNRIDLNLLVALDALLAECNVTRAGKRLSLSQPATSAALARLRKMFDDPLLVRSGRSLRPTPLAESLEQPVREILSLVEATLAERPCFDPSTDERHFTIAAGDYTGILLLRPLLEALAKEAPGVTVSVHPTIGAGHVIREGVDLALYPRQLAEQHSAGREQALFTDRLVLVACRHHPDLRERPTPTMFAALPYVAQPPGPLGSFIDAQLDAAGLHRKPTMTAESLAATPFLLRGTRLVGVLLERFAQQLADAAELAIYDLPVPTAPITESMFWHPRWQRDPAHYWLRERVAALAAAL
jgi:DNA-binding transcriptional LysR family regulator